MLGAGCWVLGAVNVPGLVSKVAISAYTVANPLSFGDIGDSMNERQGFEDEDTSGFGGLEFGFEGFVLDGLGDSSGDLLWGDVKTGPHSFEVLVFRE